MCMPTWLIQRIDVEIYCVYQIERTKWRNQFGPTLALFFLIVMNCRASGGRDLLPKEAWSVPNSHQSLAIHKRREGHRKSGNIDQSVGVT